MPTLKHSVPKYRKHRASGQAVVTISGHDHYLGPARWPINAIDWDNAQQSTFEIQSNLFGSHHPGGCHFLMTDGSVHYLSENMDEATYHTLANRADGLPVGGFSP